LCPARPKSSQGDHDATYEQALREAFIKYNPSHRLLEEELYGVIYYFHNVKSSIDVDNMPKKILDGLKTVAYDDDSIFKLCFAGKFDLRQSGIERINTNGMPQEIFEEFIQMIDEQEHLLYVEVGRYNDSMVVFGMEG
jgi:hypothetical protein